MRMPITILLLILLCYFRLNAQYIDLAWSKAKGGSNIDEGYSVATDAGGNVYTTGTFRGTADFDPGPGQYNLTAQGVSDVFISKLDASGNFVWAKQIEVIGALYAFNFNSISISVDINNNLIIGGIFIGSVDFDPGPGVHLLFSQFSNCFILKLDASGNLIWVKQFGGAATVWSNSMCLDSYGNIYTQGWYAGSNNDFDPGPGVYQLPSGIIFLNSTFFVSKLDPAGNFVWAKAMIGGNQGIGKAFIAVDANGNVFTTGYFVGTVDFDPGPSTYNLTCNDSYNTYISKLDALGNFAWAKQFKGLGNNLFRNMGTSLALDAMGNVYTIGDFTYAVDLDPGPLIYNLYSSSGNVFISKLDPAGNFIWARQLGGSSAGIVYSSWIFKGANGKTYLTGYFSGNIDFDPGPGIYNLRAIGFHDIFVAMLDASDNFIAAKQMGGTGSVCRGACVKADIAGNIYVTGFFNNSCDFNPCLGSTILTSAGNNDIFTAKLELKIPSATITTSSTSVLCGSSVTFTATTLNCGPSPVYQWQVNGINVGTNSPTYTVNNLVNGDVVRVIISSSACYLISPIISNVIVMTVNPIGTPAVNVVADNANICVGTPVTFTATPVNGGNAPIYQWQVNGTNVGTNSPVYTALSLANGDIVKVLMTSSDVCMTPGAFSSNTIPITVNPKLAPSVSIAAFPGDICYGTMVTIQATPINGGNHPSYSWQLNGSVVGTNRSSFITSSLVDGDIIDCIMTSNYNCLSKTTDTSNKIVIKIDSTVCPIGFYMPTGFTPNNDGKNDFCRPFLFGRVVSYRFSLYNRWGQRIFETTDLQKGWDGRLLGTNQDTNIFIWMCSYQFQNQPMEFKKGTVVLIR